MESKIAAKREYPRRDNSAAVPHPAPRQLFARINGTPIGHRHFLFAAQESEYQIAVAVAIIGLLPALMRTSYVA
ncbi:hypothetical protein [Mycolicibacterium helvum]|uniref:hypothetical protein n=1 Tax=Mycolicibacterium helvum TaxID=1534349 RepID=UPI0013D3A919|nr:hypothetical protein [Mycolicibacterium helvum]